MQDTKAAILSALSAFIRQRPGLDFANYGDISAYRSELRSITKDRHHAEELLAAVSWRSISADDLLAAARGAFSGRLSLTVNDNGGVSVNYCTGQYFPTEYRRAACTVLASALWGYWRECCAPEAENKAQRIRDTAKRELSRAVARRYFS
jgi:hypothetical protein